MRELPPQEPGRGGKGILRLGSAARTPRSGSRGLWHFENLSFLSCRSRQNSSPFLVRLLGNPEGMVRNTWLPGFVRSPHGETEARLDLSALHPLTCLLSYPVTRLPFSVTWVRLPSPAQGSPAGLVAQCPGGAGCTVGQAPAPGEAEGR
jgi:hypothetical protein